MNIRLTYVGRKHLSKAQKQNSNPNYQQSDSRSLNYSWQVHLALEDTGLDSPVWITHNYFIHTLMDFCFRAMN